MRHVTSRFATVGALLLAAATSVAVHAANASEFTLEGKWKLVVLSYGEDEFLVLNIQAEDEQFSGEVADAQRFLAGAKIESIEREGENVTLVIGGVGESVFRGRVANDGPWPGSVLGMFEFRGTSHPARLEPTEVEKVGPLNRDFIQQLQTLARTQEIEQRVAGLKELLAATSGPYNHLIYSDLLKIADDAGLEADAVRGLVNDWLTSAAQFGDAWKNEVRTKALQALSGSEPYADVSLDLAKQALDELGEDASAAQQAAVLAAVVTAARLAEATDLAETAAARLEKIEAKLDAEYSATVPPFQPEKFAGRDEPAHDRVVLLELFTGAECPPCVAADVAFDALLKTYGPSELVTLQYHLHIPGPDPLTNEDTIARSEYYSLRGTPSPYFNGQDSAPGGGGMSGAEAKYGEYREVVNGQLDEAAAAKIELKVTRSGGKIIIQATAEPPAENNTDAAEEVGDDAADGDVDAAKKPDLRLRLALSEESIRYVGGNGLRFHHSVVRALPGGAEGIALKDGRAEVELTVDTQQIRQDIQQYLDDYPAGFPRPTPKIALKDLSVVAFVQDDTDKTVLHAVRAEVPEN